MRADADQTPQPAKPPELGLTACAPPVGSLPPLPGLLTIEAAAKRLGVSRSRLRARCRRQGHRVGECVVAILGDDVVAFKFGPRWRVRFKPQRGIATDCR